MSLILSGTDGLSDVDGSAATPAIRGTDTNTGMFFPAADTIAFSEGGTESMRIDSSGRVGIGTSSPTNTLQVAGGITATGSAPAFQASAAIIDVSAGVARFNATGADNSTNGTLTFNTASANAGVFNERMRIASGGNVLVGSTVDNGFKFKVVGGNTSQVLVDNDGSRYTQLLLQRNATSNTGGDLLVDGTNATMSLRMLAAGAMTFNTSASAGDAVERMRITSSGDLIVGTTATINSERLNVRQSSSANTTGIAVGYGTAAGQFRSMSIISNNVMTFNNGSNEASLSAAGAWTNASDARLKNSIVDIKYGLQTVLATQPRSYKMNDLEGDYIGFVAQELQTVIPEVVSGDPETQLGVDYGSLVAVAFKAIQELKVELDSVKAELQTLKGK